MLTSTLIFRVVLTDSLVGDEGDTLADDGRLRFVVGLDVAFVVAASRFGHGCAPAGDADYVLSGPVSSRPWVIAAMICQGGAV